MLLAGGEDAGQLVLAGGFVNINRWRAGRSAGRYNVFLPNKPNCFIIISQVLVQMYSYKVA